MGISRVVTVENGPYTWGACTSRESMKYAGLPKLQQERSTIALAHIMPRTRLRRRGANFFTGLGYVQLEEYRKATTTENKWGNICI